MSLLPVALLLVIVTPFGDATPAQTQVAAALTTTGQVTTVIAPISSAATTTATTATSTNSQPFTKKDLVGKWETSACSLGRYLGPDPIHTSTFFTRKYSFTQKTWEGDYTFYSSAQCTNPLFTVRWAGSYSLGAVVKTEPTAREGDFNFNQIYLTIKNAALLPKAQGCGGQMWQLGVEQDISATGCSSLSPLLASTIAYPTDHDIVAIHDGYLIPGFRTPKMGTAAGRPTHIQNIIIGAKCVFSQLGPVRAKL